MQDAPNTPNDDHGVFPSVAALAKFLGLSRKVTYDRLNDGSIPSIRLGRRFVLPRAAIADWLRSAGGWQVSPAAPERTGETATISPVHRSRSR